MSARVLRSIADRLPVLYATFRFVQALRRDLGWWPRRWLSALRWFVRDYRKLSRQATSPAQAPTLRHLSPYLRDRRATTPLEPVYFFQNSWAARKIAAIGCRRHVDVGSSASAMAIIAQFVPVTMVDIRPLELEAPGLEFRRGSVLALPFGDQTVECISSLCVVEHIGLGRYGDPVDALGTEKAIAELRRVLRPGGHLLLSVPVDDQCRIYFNAHRAFTRDYLQRLFAGLHLVEEQYQYGPRVYDRYDAAKGFGTGMFHLRRAA